MRDLFTYLKPYRNQIVLIGGWVPYFLLEKYASPGGEYNQHVGSLDIDIALDAFSIPADAYKTILEILKERGFYHRKDNLGIRLGSDLFLDIKEAMRSSLDMARK